MSRLLRVTLLVLVLAPLAWLVFFVGALELGVVVYTAAEKTCVTRDPGTAPAYLNKGCEWFGKALMAFDRIPKVR